VEDLKAKTRETLVAWGMVIPALLVISIIAFLPLFQTFYNSFFETGLRPDIEKKFVGFGNYVELFKDDRFQDALKNTIFFTIVSVILETIFGLLIAILVNQPFKMRGVVRAAMLIPWAIPTAISSQMWKWMFDPSSGILTKLLEALNIVEPGVPILAMPNTAMWAIIAVDVWKTTPFMALLILAGLQLIPEELYEAARIDGANIWQRFSKITLPMVQSTIGVALIFRTLDALRVFDVVFIMTRGSVNTETLAVYNRVLLMDRAFSGAWFGYGSALSVIIFVLISIFAVIYIRSLRIKLE